MPGTNVAKPKWIRGGRIVTATEDFTGEILVREGKIVAMGQDLKALASGAEEVDAGGLLIFPGGIDAHTHLDLPFMGTSSSDDFETGTIAAAVGGTTSIIDFAIQSHGKSLKDALNVWHEKAAGKAVIDYAFHMAVTDLNDNSLAEIPAVIESGVTSIKCFMAYKGALMVDDGQLFRLMQTAKKLGAIVTVHAENAELIESLVPQFLKEGKTAPVYHELAHTRLAKAKPRTVQLRFRAWRATPPILCI